MWIPVDFSAFQWIVKIKIEDQVDWFPLLLFISNNVSIEAWITRWITRTTKNHQFLLSTSLEMPVDKGAERMPSALGAGGRRFKSYRAEDKGSNPFGQ